jgi:NADPH:quinone reductase
VLDNVGRPTPADAWALLAPGGNLQSIGWSSGEPAVFRPYATIGPAKSLTSFRIGGDVSEVPATLAVGSQLLAVDPGWRGSRHDIDRAADAMLDSSLRGKATLNID